MSTPSIKYHLEQIHESSPFNTLGDTKPVVKAADEMYKSFQSEDIVDTIDLDTKVRPISTQQTTPNMLTQNIKETSLIEKLKVF